jgi:hypothetical protein
LDRVTTTGLFIRASATATSGVLPKTFDMFYTLAKTTQYNNQYIQNNQPDKIFSEVIKNHLQPNTQL